MKKILLFIFIIIFLTLSGCSNSIINSKSNKTMTVHTEEQQPQKEYVPSIPSKTQFFINSDEGWKATYKFLGMSQENMILYRTKDGGKTWIEIANSTAQGSTLPGGTKSGMCFISSNRGWITTNSPSSGDIGLYTTMDGGVTWSKQNLQIPNKFKNSTIESFPPLFLSNSDGILLIFPYVNDSNSRDFLFYVTHDGGHSWLITNKDSGISNEIKWNLKKDNSGSYEIIYHNSTWIFEGDTWVKQ